jgi:GT2 family glycosyltransferase
MEPVLSVVIVNWNTRALLHRCLETVRAEESRAAEGRFEIIVVDNASSDGTAAMIRDGFPDVTVVENRANVGFAAANNQGIRRATGELILLLNPDTEIFAGSLQTMVRTMRASEGVGAAGACLVNPDGSLQASASPQPTLGREIWRLFHLDRLHPLASYPLAAWDAQRPHKVEVAQGAALILRRAALEEVGVLDEDYFMYTEEVDLCSRLRKAGWQILWLPNARVLHWGGQSTRQVKAEMFLRLYESKILFFRKHYGPAAALAYKAVLALAAIPRIVLSPMARRTPSLGTADGDEVSPNYLHLLKALPGL